MGWELCSGHCELFLLVPPLVPGQFLHALLLGALASSSGQLRGPPWSVLPGRTGRDREGWKRAGGLGVPWRRAQVGSCRLLDLEHNLPFGGSISRATDPHATGRHRPGGPGRWDSSPAEVWLLHADRARGVERARPVGFHVEGSRAAGAW